MAQALARRALVWAGARVVACFARGASRCSLTMTDNRLIWMLLYLCVAGFGPFWPYTNAGVAAVVEAALRPLPLGSGGNSLLWSHTTEHAPALFQYYDHIDFTPDTVVLGSGMLNKS